MINKAMINKALLTEAFEKMGPESVERMLLAFGPGGDQMSYCRCALGYAAGFEKQTPRWLGEEMRASDIEGRDNGSILAWFARRLDITVEQADELENCHAYSAKRGDLMALANEWLENLPAVRRTRPVEVEASR